mgnify:CR=1 FL=1
MQVCYQNEFCFVVFFRINTNGRDVIQFIRKSERGQKKSEILGKKILLFERKFHPKSINLMNGRNWHFLNSYKKKLTTTKIVKFTHWIISLFLAKYPNNTEIIHSTKYNRNICCFFSCHIVRKKTLLLLTFHGHFTICFFWDWIQQQQQKMCQKHIQKKQEMDRFYFPFNHLIFGPLQIEKKI